MDITLLSVRKQYIDIPTDIKIKRVLSKGASNVRHAFKSKEY